MNINIQLAKEHSKPNCIKVALYVGADEDRFAKLFAIMLSDDQEIARRAAWALSFVFDKYPFLFKPYLKELVELMGSKKHHQAIKRTATQVLQDVELPEELEGIAYDYGVNILTDPDETIAVKAYTMQILERIILKFPELKQEVKLIVENIMPFASAGVKVRGRRLLDKIFDESSLTQRHKGTEKI